MRGPYCNMGVCFECVIEVDGALVQACMTPVRAGMHVATGVGRAARLTSPSSARGRRAWRAALTLREHGASVLLVDEQARPGGQIYRQPPAGFEVAHWLEGKAYAPGRELLAAAGGLDGVDWRSSTTAWGVFGLQAALDSFA